MVAGPSVRGLASFVEAGAAAKAKVEDPTTKPPKARETAVPLLSVIAGPPMERVEPSMPTADVPKGVNVSPAAASELLLPLFAVFGGAVANGMVEESTTIAVPEGARKYGMPLIVTTAAPGKIAVPSTANPALLEA
ncbi:MAG: hypothetical protein Q9217_001954 [Psora testacea]